MKKILFSLLFAFTVNFGYSQIILNSDIKVAAQRSVDGKQYHVIGNRHYPYKDTAQFMLEIPKTRRHVGEIAYVFNVDSTAINVWQFLGGIESNNFKRIDAFIPLSEKAAPNGVATLGATGKVPLSQLPALTLNEPTYVQTLAEMLANDSAVIGKITVVGDSSRSYSLMADPSSDFGNWLEILSPIPSNTDLLPEGITNLYYTDTRARNALNGAGTVTYNPITGVITGTGTTLTQIDSAVNAAPKYLDTLKVTGNIVQGLKNGTWRDQFVLPASPDQFNPIAGSNITLSGVYPNITFNSSGGSGGGKVERIYTTPDSLYQVVEYISGVKDSFEIVGGGGSGGSTGGDYHLPYNGVTTDYLGGDTAYHALPSYSTPTWDAVTAVGASSSRDVVINGVNAGSGGVPFTTKFGAAALSVNTGYPNTAFGVYALTSNIAGKSNTAVGMGGLYENVVGNYNVAIGDYALSASLDDENIGVGFSALTNLNTGSRNIAIGNSAGGSYTYLNANKSIFIGGDARSSIINPINQIVIGDSAIGNGNNSITLGNSAIINTVLFGNIQNSGYGSGLFTGTPTYNLGVTAAGDIIEVRSPIITSQSGAPSSTPAKVGDMNIDITNKKLYFATGTASSSDWTIAN